MLLDNRRLLLCMIDRKSILPTPRGRDRRTTFYAYTDGHGLHIFFVVICCDVSTIDQMNLYVVRTSSLVSYIFFLLVEGRAQRKPSAAIRVARVSLASREHTASFIILLFKLFCSLKDHLLREI